MDFDENLADFGCGLEEETLMSKNGAAFLKSYARTVTVLSKVSQLEGVEEKEKFVKKYLDFCYNSNEDGELQGSKNPLDISFQDPGFEAISSNSLPNLKENSACYLYLIEFFTHCCINCIHSIEDVREVHETIEATFPGKVAPNGFKGMKVISVHSPKFPREKDVDSIRSFCKRMRMEHSEVVNDPQCKLWNELGVTCWPTLLILGPSPTGNKPNLLFTLMGEGHKEDLLVLINTCMKYFRETGTPMLNRVEIVDLEDGTDVDSVDSAKTVNAQTSFLRFPGKVTKSADHIIIADSGNNRVVVLGENGELERIIGNPKKGNKDGSLDEARFYNPQGIAIQNKSIFYVADTGNHSIRKVDLELNRVTTLVQSGTKCDLHGEIAEMKSPWDLVFYNSNALIIAAAGSHRLFGYFFSTVNLFGTEHQANTLSVIAGSGREENRNNSYILKASFAQPSGLAVVTDEQECKTVYIADSESSSVRCITPKSQVAALVGGSRDPMDLFAFGDTDGKGINAKLQHPMGVCGGRTSKEIFVADTYNHKIKRIDLDTKECTTFISTNLKEPSGICKDPSRNFIYVADTNNHSVKIIDIENANIQELKILIPDNVNTSKGNLFPEKFDKEFTVNISTAESTIRFILSPLPPAYEGGHWKVTQNPLINVLPLKGEIDKNDVNEGVFSTTLNPGSSENSVVFYVVADVFFCRVDSCLKRTRKMKIVCNRNPSEQNSGVIVCWDGLTWD